MMVFMAKQTPVPPLRRVQNWTLTGAAGDDTYEFQDDWGNDSVVELADEGEDTLDFSAVTEDLTFTLAADGRVSVTDGTNTINDVADVENFIGGSGENTLVGPGVDITWYLTGDNEVFFNGVTFSAITDLTGSAAGDDTFIVWDEVTWSGTIDGGGGGADTLDLTPISDDLIFTIKQDNSVSVKTDPGIWSDLGIIPDEVLSLVSLFTDSVDIAEVKNVDKLVGGTADNTFTFKDQTTFVGTIDGGTSGRR